MRELEKGLRALIARAARGEVSEIAAVLRAGLWSERHWIVLRRDLTEALQVTKPPVPFSIRRYRPADADVLFDEGSRAERRERARRERWMRRGLGRCYVASLADGTATFMQWLCTPEENAALRESLPFVKPAALPGGVVLEGAYTPPRFRRLPIMPAAMAQIAEEGRQLGARFAVVYVEEQNASMIRAAKLAGFTPWRTRRVRRRLFLSLFSESALTSTADELATGSMRPRRSAAAQGAKRARERASASA